MLITGNDFKTCALTLVYTKPLYQYQYKQKYFTNNFHMSKSELAIVTTYDSKSYVYLIQCVYTQNIYNKSTLKFSAFKCHFHNKVNQKDPLFYKQRFCCYPLNLLIISKSCRYGKCLNIIIIIMIHRLCLHAYVHETVITISIFYKS